MNCEADCGQPVTAWLRLSCSCAHDRSGAFCTSCSEKLRDGRGRCVECDDGCPVVLHAATIQDLTR